MQACVKAAPRFGAYHGHLHVFPHLVSFILGKCCV